ncbi:PPE family protein [Mycobacterium haemophilum]|uniref:PPE family protein n=1 Tax=Mycobacterium haemophilum TaxID=29311 RepID=UPI00069A8332|nr:PPE family protein [Mycobacterium haemophilum]
MKKVDFSAIPPEVISHQFDAGPGEASLDAAALAWHQLAKDLYAVSKGIAGTLTTLTGAWQGTAAIQMAQAVAPYQAWLSDAAAGAHQTGLMTTHATHAFERARSLLIDSAIIDELVLARTKVHNDFGQDAAAIALFDDKYQEYWVTNARVMNSYAAAVADAMSKVTPFAEAPKITTAAGLVANGLAV